ncbi:MAG: SpoIIE family protein phosphatase [Actinobacteria bacterium]|nr:SpoIIE family protein phosphatase [Actinomycetota bacterium]
MAPHRSTGEWSIAVRQQAAVAHVAQLGLQGHDAEALLTEALASLAANLGVADVILFELRFDTVLVGRAAVLGGQAVGGPVMAKLRVPVGDGSMVGFVVGHGHAVASADTDLDDRFRLAAKDYGLPARAAVAAPVGSGERPWGVIVAYSPEVRSWTDDDVHFVQSMGNTTGLAIARQEMEGELRDSSLRLDLSLAAGGMGAWSWDTSLDEVTLSSSALEICGTTADAFDGTGDGLLDLVHPDDQPLLRGDVYEALQTDGHQHTQFRLVWPDGSIRWAEAWGRVLTESGFGRRLVGVVADVTERLEAEQLRAELLEAERLARAEAEAARGRLAVLADASDRFSATLDPDAVVASLAEVCVPQLADVCLVDVLDEHGQLQEVRGAALDDASLADVRELRRRRAELGGVNGVYSEARVAGRRESVLIEELVDDDFRRASEDDDHLALFRRFGARSSMVVPMVARGRVIGVLSLLVNRTDRRFDAAQLALAEELAARAALALENGRLYASRHRVARSLQAALLPPALPEIPWLELGARYRVAESDVEIGGDFYDVMEVGPDAWGVVVGDVCGRGPDAAALTGLVRHSVRTAVIRERAPSGVLGQTNDAVLDQIDDARFCTAAYLRVERSAGGARVQASSAGHPRPVLLRADGSAEFLDCAGLLLGVVPQPTLVDVAFELGPGDAVVLYTDGVTEARRGKDLFGEKRLLATLADLGALDAQEIAAGLDDPVGAYQDGADDDIAVLVVRVPAASR